MNKRVIHIRDRRPTAAAKALNRITGLVWESYPASLLDCVRQQGIPITLPREHNQVAIHSWNRHSL